MHALEWLRGSLPTPKVLLIGLALSALAASAALLFQTSRPILAYALERQIVDWHVGLMAERMASQHPTIAIVAITQSTLGRPPRIGGKTDRALLAEIVRAIDAAGARSIGLDFYFIRPTEAERDKALISAIREAKANVIIGALDDRVELEPEQRDFQRRFVAGDMNRAAGFIALALDGDDVVRFWAKPFASSWPVESFSVLLAKTVGASREPPYSLIAWLAPPQDGTDAFLTITADQLLRATGDRQKSELLGMLRGRIVLVGFDLPDTDRHRTPLTTRAEDGRMPGVLVHAHVLAQLVDGREFTILPPWRIFALLFSRVFFGFLVGCRPRHVRSDIAAGSWGALSLLTFDVFMFVTLHAIIPLTMLFVLWVLGISAGHFVWTRTLAPARDQLPASV